jgi:4-amino-4-deoxy-L-arabinose transferase-like glycosyltransferase
MPPSAALPARGTALLLALVAALLLFRLGTVPLLGPDEPRYARVAVEMARSGDFVTPKLQGQPWLEKPVLYYWMAAAAFRVFGETEASARLPSVLAALLLTATTALFGARVFGRGAGLHAGFVVGTALLTFAYGRAASMDMLLAAWVTVAIALVGLRLLGIAGSLALPGAGVAAGLAVLAKGPIGLLLPALIVGVALLIRRERTLWARLYSPAAVVLFLAVALPWYLLVYRAVGWSFIEVFFLNHNVARFTSTIHRHPGPVVYYIPVLAAGFAPWSGLLVPAFRSLAPRVRLADLFVLAWLVAPLLFFSAAGSKLPGYILPCLPPLALLMGRAADRWIAEGHRRSGERRGAALLTLAVCAVVATSPLLVARTGDPGGNTLLTLSVWALVFGFAFSRKVATEPAGAVQILRIGAAGLLLLVAVALPPILERRESGRALFLPARGREVLAWGAWRTAWMAGYFYNDGRVRQVEALPDVHAATGSGPALVLAGPAEARVLRAQPDLRVTSLAAGPRNNVLLKVERAR